MPYDYDPLYIGFLYEFNVTRDYFECHELMEELWLEEGRSPLYQGLLQVAVALYHHRNDNISGAFKLMTSAIDKLEGYPADSLGIDLGRLIDEARQYADKLSRYEAEPFDFSDLTIDIQDPALTHLVAQKTP